MATVERMLERKFQLDKATAHLVAAEAKKQLGLPKNVMYSKKLFDECQKIAEEKGLLQDGKKVPARTGFTFRQTRQGSIRALKVDSDDSDHKKERTKTEPTKPPEVKSASKLTIETEKKNAALERNIPTKSNSQESTQSSKVSKSSSSSKTTESIKSDTQHAPDEEQPVPASPAKSPPSDEVGESDTKQILPVSSPQQSKESSQESIELRKESAVEKTSGPADIPNKAPTKAEVNFAATTPSENVSPRQHLKRSGSDTEINVDKKGSSHDRSKSRRSSRSKSSAAKLSLGDLEKLKGGATNSPRKSKSNATSLGDLGTKSPSKEYRTNAMKLSSLSDLDELKGGSMHENRSKSSATSLGALKAERSPRRSRSGPLKLTESEIEKLKSASSHERRTKSKKDGPSSPDSDKALQRKGSNKDLKSKLERKASNDDLKSKLERKGSDKDLKSKLERKASSDDLKSKMERKGSDKDLKSKDRKVERSSSSNKLKKSRSKDSDTSDKRNVERKFSGTNLMSTSGHGKKSRSRKETSDEEPKEKTPIVLFDGLVLDGPLPILSDNAKIHVSSSRQGRPKHYSDDGVALDAMEARDRMSKQRGAPRRQSFGGISTCRWESGGSSSTAVTQLLRDTSDSHEDQGSRWKTDQIQIQQSLSEQRHMQQQIPQVPQRSRDDNDLPVQQGDRGSVQTNGNNSSVPLLKPARRGSIE